MKHNQIIGSIFILIVFGIFISCSQNGREILKKSYNKCQSIQNGHYKMEKSLKLMSSVDTLKISNSSHFKKFPQDSIYTFLFHSKLTKPIKSDKISSLNLLYTGTDLISYSNDYKTTMSKNKELSSIYSFRKNPALSSYLPITNTSSFPLFNDSLLSVVGEKIKFMGIETINNQECYHVKVELGSEFDTSTIRKYCVGIEYNYWINNVDFIPLQFTIKKNFWVNNDTINQFEKYKLTYYKLNHLINDSIFTINSLPSENPPKEFNKSFSLNILEKGVKAPDWEILTTKGKRVKCSDLKGELTLLEFIFSSCPPCIEQLPHINSLNNKFKPLGLNVVVISVIDNMNDLIYNQNKYHLNCTVGKSEQNVLLDYKVTKYPTTYLINKDGKIIYGTIGVLGMKELTYLRNTIIKSL